MSETSLEKSAPKLETHSRLQTESFSRNLRDVVFDRMAIEGIFEKLTSLKTTPEGFRISKGFSYLKKDILRANGIPVKDEDDVSTVDVSLDQVKKYVDKKGEKYFHKLFEEGRRRMETEFNKEKIEFEQDKKKLGDGSEASDSFKQSPYGQKILKMAEKVGGLDKLTFEQAYEAGLYNVYLEPTEWGVAGQMATILEMRLIEKRPPKKRMELRDEIEQSLEKKHPPKFHRERIQEEK